MKTALVALAALVFGVVFGFAVAEPETITKTETVEKEIPVEKVVEKEVEVEVPVTPEACISALDTAEETFALTGGAFDTMSEFFGAVEAMDVAGMEAAVDKVGTVSPQLQALAKKYNPAAEKCRGQAE